MQEVKKGLSPAPENTLRQLAEWKEPGVKFAKKRGFPSSSTQYKLDRAFSTYSTLFHP
jgi:hypothetical protein